MSSTFPLDDFVTVHADDEDSANDDLTKKSRREPREIMFGRRGVLTDEAKAHAKMVRESPGGACASCKSRKTKARDPPMTNLGFQRAYNRI